MGLRQKSKNFHVVLSRPPLLAAIRKATLCGVRPASTMVPAEAELESRSPGWRNSAYQWAAHICDFVVHRKIARGSTPSPSYAGRNKTPIHFPATCLSSARGVARPSGSCSTTAKGSGWRPNGYPRVVFGGGPQARTLPEHCERIRRNYCSRPAILTRKLHRHGVPYSPEKRLPAIPKNTYVPFSTLAH